MLYLYPERDTATEFLQNASLFLHFEYLNDKVKELRKDMTSLKKYNSIISEREK